VFFRCRNCNAAAQYGQFGNPYQQALLPGYGRRKIRPQHPLEPVLQQRRFSRDRMRRSISLFWRQIYPKSGARFSV
jgi:hypothetical protein